MQANPLLNTENLVSFDKILPEHFEPAIDEVLQKNSLQLQMMLNNIDTYDAENFIRALETMDARLESVWYVLQHLHAVLFSEALNQVYALCLSKISLYATEMGQNNILCEKVKMLIENKTELSPIQTKILHRYLQAFVLSGIALAPQAQQRYAQLQEKLSELEYHFEQNVIHANIHGTIIVDNIMELGGLSEEIIARALHRAEQNNKKGYLFNVDEATHEMIVQFAKSRLLREKMYRAFRMRASELCSIDHNNTSVITEILTTRKEIANLLNFSNAAEFSLATKMLQSPQQVIQFLENLGEQCLPKAKKEIDIISLFAKQQDDISSLMPWDVEYYREKLRTREIGLNEESVRAYFPLNKVFMSFCDLIKKLFSIRIIEQANKAVWHPEVRFFKVFNKENELCGAFYADFYARSHKRAGAWVSQYSTRRLLSTDKDQLPVAFLTCNFSQSNKSKPALLSYNEVKMVFHELGHVLQHVVTKINYAHMSGLNGVPLDASEMISLFFENWCREESVVNQFAQHYETGKTLPVKTFFRLKGARNFSAASQLLQRIQLALFDMRIHCASEFSTTHQQNIIKEIQQKYSLTPNIVDDRFQNACTLIFSNGYGAGYYSYLWSEILASDIFSKFETLGLFNENVSQNFLTTFLYTGSAYDPMKLFITFCNHQPTFEALLRHRGIQG